MSIWDFLQSFFGANSEKIRLYRQFTNCKPGEKVLDFGCATGITAAGFEDCDYLGVDIHLPSILRAQKKYPVDLHPNLKFMCADAYQLNIQEFDHVICAGTGHHLTDEELTDILERLLSKLKKNKPLHFIDITITEDTPFFARFMYFLDRGRFIRSKIQYDHLLNKLKNVEITPGKIENVLTGVNRFRMVYYSVKRVE